MRTTDFAEYLSSFLTMYAEMKRKSIENVKIKIDSELPDWVQDNSLMSMLMELSGRG